MLLSIFSVIIIDGGPYKPSYHSSSNKNINKEEEGTGLTTQNTINYNDEVLDTVHPRLNSQGHAFIENKKDQHKSESEILDISSSSFTQERNLDVSDHHVEYDNILSTNVFTTGNLIDDREGNFLEKKSDVREVKSSFCKKIKEIVIENPLVKMFTLIQWSLMKQPYFVITMIGSSYSFTALLNYFLLLPLLCKEVGLSEDKTSILLSATNASDVLFRLIFAWAGDWKCSKAVFCGKPRRMLYAISVLGLSILMIGITNIICS
jgi:hypothetical protein